MWTLRKVPRDLPAHGARSHIHRHQAWRKARISQTDPCECPTLCRCLPSSQLARSQDRAAGSPLRGAIPAALRKHADRVIPNPERVAKERLRYTYDPPLHFGCRSDLRQHCLHFGLIIKEYVKPSLDQIASTRAWHIRPSDNLCNEPFGLSHRRRTKQQKRSSGSKRGADLSGRAMWALHPPSRSICFALCRGSGRSSRSA